MQILDGHLLLSATDLVNFLGCRHATYLDLRDLTDPVETPVREAMTVLIFEKGIEHERQHLASVKARRLKTVLEIVSEPRRVVRSPYNSMNHTRHGARGRILG